jgi:methyl-accepting chemotaxis protein
VTEAICGLTSTSEQIGAQVDQVTSRIGEIVNATVEVAAGAEQLQQLVATFKLGVG